MKVVQCWDDGVANDIRLTEVFRKHGAKATFNLNPGLMHPETREESFWEKQGEDARNSSLGFIRGRLSHRDIPEIYSGFELASHCWRHESAGSIPDDAWLRSALDARHFLEDIAQKPCLGFAWPNGRATDGAVMELRKAGFAYGRTVGSTYDVTDCADPLLLDPSCHFMASDFWPRYIKAKQTGVFYFWGHSYELFRDPEIWAAFEDRIEYISKDPDAEWANVIDIVPLLHNKWTKTLAT